ncbi:hypothetical protein NP233_g10881 [Leucocoprinus birnbaumii]|uniref:SHSP domain-containing protein n=1 Tax=Leucocoprinus birnbaumii TaxID=56174 RepID=A0AAD5VHW0_9AGAR|nr:hypothetical protein NP233_g10881 [Leucocoprinus birnbaumii]
MPSVFFHDPFHDIERLFERIEDAIRPINNSPKGDIPQFEGPDRQVVPGAFKPRMDLHEDKEKNLVTATFELPGVKSKDVQLEVHEGLLTVSAEIKPPAELSENGGVKDEDIKASMVDGVLTVAFPKLPANQMPRKISITSRL